MMRVTIETTNLGGKKKLPLRWNYGRTFKLSHDIYAGYGWDIVPCNGPQRPFYQLLIRSRYRRCCVRSL